MGGNRGLGLDAEIILIMRLARFIEAAGEDETGLGLRFGGVDLHPAEGEFGRSRLLRRCRGRDKAGKHARLVQRFARREQAHLPGRDEGRHQHACSSGSDERNAFHRGPPKQA